MQVDLLSFVTIVCYISHKYITESVSTGHKAWYDRCGGYTLALLQELLIEYMLAIMLYLLDPDTETQIGILMTYDKHIGHSLKSYKASLLYPCTK